MVCRDASLDLNFLSDNIASLAPEIASAIDAANTGSAAPYGDDAWTARLDSRFSEVFGCTVTVAPVGTGTAGNALALASIAGSGDFIYCHQEAHIRTSEEGAAELFTGGARLVPLDGPDGKIALSSLKAALAGAPRRGVLSLSQTSEAGTIYTPRAIRTLVAVAREHSLLVHMDGARFANAVAALGVGPEVLTTGPGVDILSLGTAKNGTIAADAVIFLRPGLADNWRPRWRRAGQLVAKMRFTAAQLLASVDDGLWLRLAGHANDMAARLGIGLAEVAGVALAYPVEANEVFAVLPPGIADALTAAGVRAKSWRDQRSTRFVCSFNTTPAAVDAVVTVAERTAAAAQA